MPKVSTRCIILQWAGWGVTNPLSLAHVCEWNGSVWDGFAKIDQHSDLSMKWEWRDDPKGPSRPPRDESDLVELRAAMVRDSYGDVELISLQTNHGLELIGGLAECQDRS